MCVISQLVLKFTCKNEVLNFISISSIEFLEKQTVYCMKRTRVHTYEFVWDRVEAALAYVIKG